MIGHITGIPSDALDRAAYGDDPSELREALERRMYHSRGVASAQAEKVEVPWYMELIDFFRMRSELKVEVTGDNYVERRRVLVWSEQHGQKVIVTIRGKPGFAQAVASHLRLFAPRVHTYLLGE